MVLGFLIRASAWPGRVTVGGKLGGASLGLAVSLALVSAGCDSGSFVPPRPPELGGGEIGPVAAAGSAPGAAVPGRGSTTAPLAGARAIELVLGRRDPDSADEMKQKARTQAGIESLRIQVEMVGENGNPDSVGGLARKLISRDALALLVEPGRSADPELSHAVAEARDRGLPVVLIGRPLDGSKSPETKGADAGKGTAGPEGPLIQVVPEPFKNSAPRLVAAAINNARNAKLTPESGAILMVNTISDPQSEDRVQAFHDALLDAGITKIEELRFERDPTVAKQKLTELLQANPRIGMVLSTDQVGLGTSLQLLENVGQEHVYVVAGYTLDESSAKMAYLGEFAAVAIYAPERLIRKAIMSAASLARGEKLAERIEVQIPLHISPASTAGPSRYRLQMEIRKKHGAK